MVTVGALSRLGVKPGNEAIIEHALQETFSRVQLEPATTAWDPRHSASSTVFPTKQVCEHISPTRSGQGWRK
jgi:hypothetical protein